MFQSSENVGGLVQSEWYRLKCLRSRVNGYKAYCKEQADAYRADQTENHGGFQLFSQRKIQYAYGFFQRYPKSFMD